MYESRLYFTNGIISFELDALNGEPGIYSARYGFDESLDDWGRLLLLLKNTDTKTLKLCFGIFITLIGIIMLYNEVGGRK